MNLLINLASVSKLFKDFLLVAPIILIITKTSHPTVILITIKKLRL